jgi:hypothetical protein
MLFISALPPQKKFITDENLSLNNVGVSNITVIYVKYSMNSVLILIFLFTQQKFSI